MFGSQVVKEGEQPLPNLKQQASRKGVNSFIRTVGDSLGIPSHIKIQAKSGRNLEASLSVWSKRDGKMWVKGSKVPARVYSRSTASRGQVGEGTVGGAENWVPPGGWKRGNRGAVDEDDETIAAAKATTTSAITTLRVMNHHAMGAEERRTTGDDTAAAVVIATGKRTRNQTAKMEIVQEERAMKAARKSSEKNNRTTASVATTSRSSKKKA